MADNIKRSKFTVKTCKAYFKTNENNDILTNVSDVTHDHDTPSEEILNRQIVNTLTINDVRCIKNNVYRARSEELPKSPTNISTVHLALNSIDCITNENEPYLFLNDSINGVIM